MSTMFCFAASSSASAALELPPDVVAKAWADIARPSEVAKQRLALRALAAAARYSVCFSCLFLGVPELHKVVYVLW